MNTRHSRGVALFVTAALALSGTAVAGNVDANDRAHSGQNQTRLSALPNEWFPTPTPNAVVVRVDGGFDWVDAGVGAAGSLGLALALAGAASAIRRFRVATAMNAQGSLTKEA
jgi:hypothetical protein